MPYRRVPQTKHEAKKLSRTEQKSADIDAYVKRELRQSRIVDASKISRLKALRLARDKDQRSTAEGVKDIDLQEHRSRYHQPAVETARAVAQTEPLQSARSSARKKRGNP